MITYLVNIPFLTILFSRVHLIKICNYQERWSWRLWACVGWLLGCASLLRAVGHYVLALALLFIVASTMPWREKIKTSLVST